MLRFSFRLRCCAALALVFPVSLAGCTLLCCTAIAADAESDEQQPLRTGEAAILEALEETTDLEYEDAVLSEVIDKISAKHRVAMRLDGRALDEAGVGPSTPVSIHVRGIRLRSALKLLLRPHELVWTIQHSVLFITTKEKADGAADTRIYPVADLLIRSDEEPVDLSSLADVITSSIAPQSWGEGNSNDIAFLPGAMVLAQTRDVHEEIEALLDNIRRLKRLEPRYPRLDADATAAIWKAIDSPVKCQFHDRPLRDVLNSLVDQLQISVYLDKHAFTEAGLTIDQPVTVDLPPLKFRDILDIILTNLECDWVVQPDFLRITTREYTDGSLETKVYDVSDLIESNRSDERTLIDVLTSSQESRGKWDEAGGPETIEQLPGMLVVGQTRRVHELIERMLADIRAFPPPEPAPPKPDKLVRKVYRIDGVEPERMAEIVAKMIEPESWSAAGGDGTIEAVAATRPGEEFLPAKPAVPPAPAPTAPPKTSMLTAKAILAQFGGMGMGGTGNVPLDPEQARRLPDGWLIVHNRESVQRQVQALLNDLRSATQSGIGVGGGFF